MSSGLEQTPGAPGLAQSVAHRVKWATLLLAAVLLSTLLFHNRGLQAPIWTVPYLSGAANWTWGEGWRVDPASVDHFKALSLPDRWSHRFEPASGKLIPYSAHDIGFVYVCVVARAVFPFLGDLRAVQCLNWVVHVGCCLAILGLLGSGWHRAWFIVGYAANPVVIHVVTFAYYYFWQTLPSMALAWLLLRSGPIPWRMVASVVVVVLTGVLVRPSTLPVALLVVGSLLWRGRNAVTVAGALVILAGILLIPKSNKMFFMTAYVGLGAYPNPDGLVLSDDMAYRHYRAKTGIDLGFQLGGNYYEPAVRKQFNDTLGEAFREFALEHPWMLARNAVLNSCLAFAGGYINRAPFGVHLGMALLGAAFVVIQCLRGGVWWPAAALASVAGFAPYFPPIPAYMAGTYLFLVLGLAWAVARPVPAVGR